MIRYLAAFAWLRWRLLLNGLKGSRRRDVLERLSRIGALLAPILLVLPFASAGVLLAVLGFLGGREIGVGGSESARILLVPRGVLLLVCLLPILVPLGRASHGSRSGNARLLLLPIPRSALHLAGVLASLADPWLAFVVPGLLLFAAGLATSGRPADALLALGAGLAFLAVLTSLAALASFSADWLMRERRRGELVALVFILLVSILGFLPAFYGDRLEHHIRGKDRGGQDDSFSVEELDSRLPAWTRALPSEVYARSVRLELEGRSDSAWLLVLVLAAEASALYAPSSAVHRRVLDTSGGGRSRRGSAPIRVGLARWPLLTPAATAVAVVHARNALRSVRGRLAVLLPGPLLAAVAWLSRGIPKEDPFAPMLGAGNHVLLAFACLFGLYALQAFHLNQFASDRAGLSLHVISPVRDFDIVLGKAAGGAAIYATSVAICVACTALAARGGPTIAWVSVLLAAAAAYAWLAPCAAALSALFPRTADLSQTGAGGNPHALAVLGGTFAVMLCAAPSALALAIVHDRFGRPGLAAILLAGWALLSIAISFPLLRLVTPLVASRRENLLLVAGGK
jgi:hypothetical protein